MKKLHLSPAQYINGVCRFRIEGDFPERFLNICSSWGEQLYDISRRNGTICASITPARYRRLLPAARKCSVRLRVCGRYGLPFVIGRYKRRSGMVLGAFLFVGLIFLLSRFVWIVELPQVPGQAAELEAALAQIGIGQGTLRSRINTDVVETEIELAGSDIKRAGVSLIGSKLIVEVDLMPQMGEMLDESVPANLVAARDGVILSVESLEGADVVAVGQTVAQGDLLVSGVIESTSGYVSMVNARGSVWARTEHTITIEIPYTYPELSRTGKRIVVRRLMIFGAEVPLFFGSVPSGSYEREISVMTLEALSVKLPAQLRTEIWYPLDSTQVTITPEYALALAKERAEEEIAALGDIEILSRSEMISQTDFGVSICVNISAKENIAVQRPILLG